MWAAAGSVRVQPGIHVAKVNGVNGVASQAAKTMWKQMQRRIYFIVASECRCETASCNWCWWQICLWCKLPTKDVACFAASLWCCHGCIRGCHQHRWWSQFAAPDMSWQNDMPGSKPPVMAEWHAWQQTASHALSSQPIGLHGHWDITIVNHNHCTTLLFSVWVLVIHAAWVQILQHLGILILHINSHNIWIHTCTHTRTYTTFTYAGLKIELEPYWGPCHVW